MNAAAIARGLGRGGKGLIILLGLLAACCRPAQADRCSAWSNKVWLNEYYFGSGANNPPNFLEIYSTDIAFAASWQNWTVDVYSAQNTATTYTFNSATSSLCRIGGKSWLTQVIPGGLRQQNALALLKDNQGKYVDAFVFDKKAPPDPWLGAGNNWFPGLADPDTGCPALANALTTQAGLATSSSWQANMLVLPNYGNKDMNRVPDGGSIWDITSEQGSGTSYTECRGNNLNLTKIVDKPLPIPGDTITYSVSMKNSDASPIANVSIVDYLPPVLSYISATPSNGADVITTASYATTDPNTGLPATATQVNWSLAPLAPGATDTLQIKMSVPSGTHEGYQYINTAQTTGLDPNQSDFVSITIGSLVTPSFALAVSPASSSTCAGALNGPRVTITAMSAGGGTGSPLTSYNGTVMLSASSATVRWYDAGGALLPGNASPTYPLVNGTATLYITDSVAETVTLSALDLTTFSPAIMTGDSGGITFTADSLALALADNDALSPPYGAVAGRPHQLRATISNCGVVDTTRTGAYGGTVWYTAGLNHPAGAAAPTVNTSRACPGSVGPLPSSSGSAINLAFSGGVADFYLCDADVGQFALNLRLSIGAQQRTAISSHFTVRPFVVTASQFVNGAVANPQGAAKFATAGKPFSGVFDAWAWLGAADSESGIGDGLPDSGVTAGQILAANPGKTASFSGATNNAGVIGFALDVSPSGNNASHGALTPSPTVATASAGTAAISNFSYSEVGTIKLAGAYFGGGFAADSYLGATGLNVPLLSDPIGRFIPDHFTTSVTPGCSGGAFTYSGQPFTVYVTAWNGASPAAVTQNYDGTAHTSPNFAQTTTLSNAGSTANFSNNSLGPLTYNQGIASTSGATYTFPAVQTPTTLTVRAIDSDGVSSAPPSPTEDSNEIRAGRLRLDNAYGSELLGLSIPAALEYYGSGGWQNNSADQCSVLSAGHFSFGFPDASLAACETALTVAGTAPNYSLTLAPPGLGNGGQAVLTPNLGGSASGSQCSSVGGSGPVATAAGLPWLQYDWSGAGAGNPSALAVFGLYRNDVIDFREVY